MIDHIAEALDAEQPITENDIVVTSEQLNQLAKELTQPSKAPETEDSIDGDREFVQEKLKDAIEQATGMLPGLVALAKVAESPNLYNSASKFLDSLAGLGTALIDIRIKTDISQVGTLDNGLPVYSFRYKSGGPQQIGLMAQDVEKVKPHAVVEIEGVKHVNYSEAVRA